MNKNIEDKAKEYAEKNYEQFWDVDNINCLYKAYLAGAADNNNVSESELRKLIKDVFINAQMGGGYTKETEDYFYNKVQFTGASSNTNRWQEVIKKRIAHFQSIFHTFEANTLSDALFTIKELVPPSEFDESESPSQSDEEGEDKLKLSAYEDAFKDHQRLVRKLDVIINGEIGAAKQASLCDIVAQLSNVLPTLKKQLQFETNIKEQWKIQIDELKKENEELRSYFPQPGIYHIALKEWESAQLIIKELKAALKELVELKDMRDNYDGTNPQTISEYQKRKPLAWEAARKLIGG